MATSYADCWERSADTCSGDAGRTLPVRSVRWQVQPRERGCAWQREVTLEIHSVPGGSGRREKLQRVPDRLVRGGLDPPQGGVVKRSAWSRDGTCGGVGTF